MFNQTPPITKNLIIINALMFFAQYVFELRGIDLAQMLGLHYFMAENFWLWQAVTYMFLHGDFTHLFFNMFSLWMFGRIIEGVMGPKRFLTYYFVCGLGAAFCQELWQLGEYTLWWQERSAFIPFWPNELNQLQLNSWTTIGASGACYGILLAFGMTFPNERILLLIPPIPIKAKYFVFGYAVIELLASFSSNSNIAHFAHSGGMLFGLFLLLHWRRQQRNNSGGFRGWDNWQHPSAKKKESFLDRLKNLFGGDRKMTVKKNDVRFKDRDADYEYNARRKEKDERVDQLLDKIRRSGYESLSEEEKQELFRNTKR